MILIFDTNGGLCNQFYDITNGINFCLENNILFSFRYCAFRNDNLFGWYQQPFEKLFDTSFLNQYNLYIPFHQLKEKITNENCFNLNDNLLSHEIFKDDNYLNQIINLNKEYVVLKQFWCLNKFRNFSFNDNSIYKQIIPSKPILEKYFEIKKNLGMDFDLFSFNFLHYRYEIDFTNHFKCNIESLESLLGKIKFNNNNLKIYVATSNIKNLINVYDNKFNNIIFKNEDLLSDFNFEEKAFIDYMFGINSTESIGHSKSSFSIMINSINNFVNYYDT